MWRVYPDQTISKERALPRRISAGVRRILEQNPARDRDAILKGRIRNRLFVVVTAQFCTDIDHDRHSRDNEVICKMTEECELVVMPNEVEYYAGRDFSPNMISYLFNSYEM